MKTLPLLLCLLFAAIAAPAQDLIIRKTGEEIPAKIVEVTPAEISYRHPDSLAGRTLSLPRQEVFLVKYANGTKEVFTVQEAAAPSPEEMYQRGRQDARQYYKGHGLVWAAAGILFVGTATTGVGGLIGSAGLAAIPPRIKARNLPEPLLLQNPNYVQGYQRQAHRKKVGKVLIGSGISTGVLVTALAALMSGWH